MKRTDCGAEKEPDLRLEYGIPYSSSHEMQTWTAKIPLDLRF